MPPKNRLKLHKRYNQSELLNWNIRNYRKLGCSEAVAGPLDSDLEKLAEERWGVFDVCIDAVEAMPCTGGYRWRVLLAFEQF